MFNMLLFQKNGGSLTMKNQKKIFSIFIILFVLLSYVMLVYPQTASAKEIFVCDGPFTEAAIYPDASCGGKDICDGLTESCDKHTVSDNAPEIWVCTANSGFIYSDESSCISKCTAFAGLCKSIALPPTPTPTPTPTASTILKLDLKNSLGSIDSFAALAEAIFRAIVIIAIPLTVIFLIWGGLVFVTARGNETQLGKAKKIFFWSVIGAMVIVASWVIAVGINNSIKDL